MKKARRIRHRKRAVSMNSGKVLRPAWDGYAGCLCGRPATKKLLAEVTARIAVEHASTFGWERYVGRKSGRIIGMKTFGASAPLKELLRKFQFEPERVTRSRKSCSARPRVEVRSGVS